MLTELKVACVVLTRLPVRLDHPPSPPELAAAVHWFPLVGAIVGAAAALAYLVAGLLGLPGLTALLLALGTQVLLTGALHESGLADSIGALAAGPNRERALALLREPRLGTPGVVALVLSLLARVAALTSFWSPASFAAALIAASAASRSVLPAIMAIQPGAPTGPAAQAPRPEPTRVALGLGLGAAIALALLPPRLAAEALLWAAAAAAASATVLGRRFGGCSGHTLGAVQQATEIAFLFALTAEGWPRAG